MIILKEYSRGLKKYTIDHNDPIELACIFGMKAVDVAKYLKENNKVAIVDDTYDPQSGWTGFHVQINGIELRGNGYVSVNEDLLESIIG